MGDKGLQSFAKVTSSWLSQDHLLVNRKATSSLKVLLPTIPFLADGKSIEAMGKRPVLPPPRHLGRQNQKGLLEHQTYPGLLHQLCL